jgi:hypothetical protein
MFFELLELLQFVQEVELTLLVGVDVVHPDPVGSVCVLLPHVLPLDLVQHAQLLCGG